MLSITKYYRKFTEKSRLFCVNYLGGKRIDFILMALAVAVFAVLFVKPSFKKADKFKHTDIVVPPHCGDLFGKDVFASLVREFEEQNPDIRISTASGKETALREDIVFFEGGEFHRFLSDSSLLSLSPYINAEAETESLALPLVFFMDLFFYNIDILKAADCDRPPKTRADFLAAARAVANLKNVFPLAVGFGGLAGEGTPKQVLRRDLYPWIWADNSPSRERPLFRERAPSREDEPPKEGEPSKESDLSIKGIDVILVSASDQSPALSRASINAVAFLELLNREGLLAPGAFEKTGEQRLKEFAEGKIAMMAGSVRDIPFLRKNVNGFDFGITAVPTTATGKNRLGLSGIYAGISGACTQPDEAWAFLEFIAGKNETLAQALDAVPGCFPSSFPADYIANDPLYSKAWDIFEAAETVDQYGPSSLDDIFLYDEAERLIREKLAEIPFR